MNNRDNRKVLGAKVYRIIFREIYPITRNNFSIGDADHAIEINKYTKIRKIKGYAEYNYLGLLLDDNVDVAEIEYTINEKSFHNWINGTSSPKYLMVINSIVEYLINSCNDEGKLNLLRIRILQLLKSNEFNEYVGHLIEDTVETWISKIENNDNEALFRATKEILYLLKDKNKYIPYLLKEYKEKERISEVKVEELIKVPEEELYAEELTNTNNKAGPKRVKNKYVLWVMLFIICTFAFGLIGQNSVVQSPISHNDTGNIVPKITSPVNNSLFPKSDIEVKWNSVKTADSYLVVVIDMKDWTTVYSKSVIKETCRIVLEKSLFKSGSNYSIYVHTIIGGEDSALDHIDINFEKLVPPEITSPENNSKFSISDIKVRWKSIKSADSYLVTVSDTRNWAKIFIKSKVEDTFVTLDKSLFKSGGFYRIYVHTTIGKEDSEPNYIDINTEN